MPGVLIVEAMAQVAGVLVLKDMPDRANKLVFLAGIDNAKFRRPVLSRRPASHRDEGAEEEGQRGQDARAGHRGRRGGRGGRGALQAGRPGAGAPAASARCPIHPTAVVDPSARIDRSRRDRPLLHHRPGGRDRRPHAPDGSRLHRRPHLDRRGQHLLSLTPPSASPRRT